MQLASVCLLLSTGLSMVNANMVGVEHRIASRRRRDAFTNAGPFEANAAGLRQLLNSGAGEDFLPVKTGPLINGQQQIKFYQTYYGVRVYNSIVTVTTKDGSRYFDATPVAASTDNRQHILANQANEMYDVAGRIPTVTGRLLEDPSEALQSLQQLPKDTLAKSPNPRGAIMSALPSGCNASSVDAFLPASHKPAVLLDSDVYVYSLNSILTRTTAADSSYNTAVTVACRWESDCGIIDMATNRLVIVWSCVQRAQVQVVGVGGNNKEGVYRYGTDRPALPASVESGRCVLRHSDFNIVAYHMRRHDDSDLNNLPPYSVSCCAGSDLDAVNGADGPVNDVLFAAVQTVNMTRTYFNEHPWTYDDSIHGAKTKSSSSPTIVVGAHYGFNQSDAFFSPWYTMFGDGDGVTYYPMTSVEIVGHEIGHGTTSTYSNLEYDGQSGGINEAFSDIMGKTVEHFVYGRIRSWTIGYDVVVNGDGFRYMDQPTNDGHSIDNLNNYNDYLDVHESSGIFNKLFYLLVNTYSWPVKSAFSVFYRANQLYWSASDNFVQAFCGLAYAAHNLALNTSQLRMAGQGVGIMCPVLEGCRSSQQLMSNNYAIPFTLLFDYRSFTISSPCAYNLRIRLFSQNPANAQTGVNVAIYVKRTTIPLSILYDYKSDYPTGVAQQVDIPVPDPGTYYILLAVRGPPLQSAVLTIQWEQWAW